VKSRELNRIAIREGWKLLYQDSTSHRVYVKNGKTIVIPYHGAKEVPVGTANKILKQIKGAE
jgi:mRNA interferase HicA